MSESESFDAQTPVNAGFDLLTRDLGPGWVNDVDLDTLETVSVFNCVLAQLYGEYITGRDHLRVLAGDDYRRTFPERHGFDAPHVTDEEYAALDDEWKARITAARV